MIKFSIIINTHNQTEYIHDAINSCLKQTYKNYEIILVDSSRKKINLNKYYNNKKKINYIHSYSKYNQPELNQMSKIILGYKKSRGEYIVFLDGDDYFHPKKLFELNKFINNKNIICNQDLPIIFNKNIKKKLEKKRYKNKFFIRYILNDWPQIYGTSSIVIKKEFLTKYLKKINPLDWKYLAIDAQLILFSNSCMAQLNYLEGLTFKRLHKTNLGSSYMNIFKKKFWARRYMQFLYCEHLTNKKKFSIDYLITKLIYFTLKIL